MKKATLHSDGGARGNPGPAGIGFVLKAEGKEPIEYGEYIGETTNNQAEYTALIKGMGRALKDGVTNLECFLDSELVVKQLQGDYRVRNQGLRPLCEEVQELIGKFCHVAFRHVPREKNKRADGLVNRAINKAARGKP